MRRNKVNIYIPDHVAENLDALIAALKADGKSLSGELRPVIERLMVEHGVVIPERKIDRQAEAEHALTRE